MKIAHRGLILVAVPLMFELVFVGSLWILMKTADEESRRADHTKAVVSEANYLGKLIYESMSCAIGFAVEHTAEEEAHYQRLMSEVPPQIEKLRLVANESPQQVEHFKKVEYECNKTLKNLEILHRYAEQKKREPLMFIPWVERLRQCTQNVVTSTRALTLDAIEKSRTNQSSIAARAYLEPVLLTGLAVNIALSILLAVFFSNGITRRLAQLSDNSKRLAAGQPLNQPLEGDDEIGKLDHSFHRMAQALNEAVRKERAVVEQARDVICSVDAEGKFTAVNPAVLDVWQYEPDLLIGRRVGDIIANDEREKVSKTFLDAIEGDGAAAIETRLVKKDGSELDVLWSLTWSQSEQSYYCVVLDNSQRKEIERLKQSFVQMVTHDLRSPLTSILGTLHVLQENKQEPLQVESLAKVQRMERVTERLLKLVNDLLQIESLGKGSANLHVRETSSGFIAEQSIAAVETLIKTRNITIVEDIRIFDLRADSDRIIQVLVNLLSNAIRFSEDGQKIHLQIHRKDHLALFSVSDSGPGIALENFAQIFEPFKQVKVVSDNSISGDDSVSKAKEGTGLGLAISRAIVESHGGTIRVESELGKGARFLFEIPVGETK